MTLGGRPISCCACSMAATASPSEVAGARLNEITVAGNWPRWSICSGAVCSRTLTIARTGPRPPPLEPAHQPRRPRIQLVRIGVLQHELVLGPADRGVDAQILCRLHVEVDAGNSRGLLFQAPDNIAHVRAALAARLEVDQQPAAVE